MLCVVVKAQENCSKKKEDTVPADHRSSEATQKMDLMLLDEERGGILCFIVLKEDTGAISAVSFFLCHKLRAPPLLLPILILTRAFI